MKKIVIALLPFVALAQERLTVPFSDPNRPGTVRVHALDGSISVVGGPGKEVVIETSGGGSRVREGRDVPQGMRRIAGAGGGLEVQEENNVIKINAEDHGRQDLRIQVPVKTSLVIRAVNRGVTVEGTEGEVDAGSVNGHVIIKNISGSVIANTVNGKVEAVLNAVTPDKPMSFTTLNGTVDVTLPATTKANLRMRTENGDIYSDFDVTLKGDQRETKTEVRGEKRKWKSESFTLGTINGGGPEIRFESMNGRVYIRKK